MSPITTISVAVCTYNGEAFLKEQLESILAQTVQPNELVISDDGSWDSTLEIINIFREACAFPVRVVINTETLWVTKNFENAIASCTGEIIVLADQDDVWQPHKLETIIKAFQENPNCGYVFSNAVLINEVGKPLDMDLWQSIGFSKARIEKYRSGDQLEVMLRGGNFVYGMTMSFRSIFNSCLLPIESESFDCAHDSWIALMLSARGAYGVAVSDCLVRYRQHTRQVSGADRKIKFSKYIMRIRTDRGEGNSVLADALESIAARLKCDGQSEKYAAHARKLLTDKASHLRVRSLAGSLQGFQKLKIVFREAISGRYGQFSGAFKSILKDLITSSAEPKGE